MASALLSEAEIKALGLEGESIIRDIVIACEMEHEREVIRYAKAMFDTGCPDNVISRRVAARLGFCSGIDKTKYTSLVTLTGHEYVPVGVLKGRWAVGKHIGGADMVSVTGPIYYMDAEFLVSSNENDTFDVIIGFNTIKKYRLLELGERLLAALRRPRKVVDERKAREDQAKADRMREANAKAKQEHEKSKEMEKATNTSITST